MTDKRSTNGSTGMAVDAKGNVAYDPSQNVLSLVEAAVQRLDDLRAAESRRVDELRTMGTAHTHELLVVRSLYEDKLMSAEAKRIDAIRAVDVNAVAVASQRAADQATVLATQVAQSAEAIRTALGSTAATIAAQMDSKFAGITERIAALEKSSYEGKGRSAYTDPIFSELVTKLDRLNSVQAASTGKSTGMSVAWAVLLGAIAAISSLIAIGSFVFRGRP